MSHENGHIFAPISTDDVSYVLGENTHDVADLCTSQKINPYSLIRPAFTTNPIFGPESFENGIAEGPIPENGTDWFYTLKKWGYYVPFVGSPANISLIVDKPWIRNIPDEKSYKCLTHFDGYLHDVVPTLPVSADVTPGRNIVMFLSPGDVQQNIISPSGMANNGGVVALYEVLGSVRIGCSLYERNNLRGHFISPNPIGTQTQQDIVPINTTVKAQSDMTYRIIPWATDGDLIDGVPTYNASFFTLKFAPDFGGYLTIDTPHYFVAITDVKVTKTDSGITFDVTIANTYTTTQTINNFRLRVQYQGDYNVVSKEVSLYGTSSIDVKPNTSETFTVYTTDSEIVNNYDKLLSMIIVAQWGANDIPSQELAGPVVRPV